VIQGQVLKMLSIPYYLCCSCYNLKQWIYGDKLSIEIPTFGLAIDLHD
jgi:hypothetical protein